MQGLSSQGALEGGRVCRDTLDCRQVYGAGSKSFHIDLNERVITALELRVEIAVAGVEAFELELEMQGVQIVIAAKIREVQPEILEIDVEEVGNADGRAVDGVEFQVGIRVTLSEVDVPDHAERVSVVAVCNSDVEQTGEQDAGLGVDHDVARPIPGNEGQA